MSSILLALALFFAGLSPHHHPYYAHNMLAHLTIAGEIEQQAGQTLTDAWQHPLTSAATLSRDAHSLAGEARQIRRERACPAMTRLVWAGFVAETRSLTEFAQAIRLGSAPTLAAQDHRTAIGLFVAAYHIRSRCH